MTGRRTPDRIPGERLRLASRERAITQRDARWVCTLQHRLMHANIALKALAWHCTGRARKRFRGSRAPREWIHRREAILRVSIHIETCETDRMLAKRTGGCRNELAAVQSSAAIRIRIQNSSEATGDPSSQSGESEGEWLSPGRRFASFDHGSLDHLPYDHTVELRHLRWRFAHRQACACPERTLLGNFRTESLHYVCCGF